MYDLLVQYDWKHSAGLNRFQSRAWKVLFAVMKSLWVWALVCAYTTTDWDDEKSPSLSAVRQPG